MFRQPMNITGDDMMDFTAAYTALKFAKDAFKFTLEQKIDDKVHAQISEAMDKIGKVQDDLFLVREELLKLQEENHTLKELLREKESWEKQVEEVYLYTTSAGDHLYRFKGLPERFACPVCYVKKELYILQWNDKPYKYECKACKSEFRAQDYPDNGILVSDYDPLSRY